MNPRHQTIFQMRNRGDTWSSIKQVFGVSIPRVQEIYREQKVYQELVALHPIIALLRNSGHKTTAARVATLFRKNDTLSAAALASLGGQYVLNQPRYGRALVEQLAGALETMGLIGDRKLWISS